jgi:hypothetical protein
MTKSFTKTAVTSMTDIVLDTPCLSIQLAISPGIIFPMAAYEKVSTGEKIRLRDMKPAMKPNSKVKTKRRLP